MQKETKDYYLEHQVSAHHFDGEMELFLLKDKSILQVIRLESDNAQMTVIDPKDAKAFSKQLIANGIIEELIKDIRSENK